MHLIATLITGVVVGWLASILMKTRTRMGILANVIVGVSGSYLGVFLVLAMGVGPYGQDNGRVVPVLGAALLIALLWALGVFNRLPAIWKAPWAHSPVASLRRSEAVLPVCKAQREAGITCR
jgi:uncharacterized membrane protein YeaQ/YmgE (transglycosylase-associated protein family)